jgi:hypothetical protein
MLSHLYGVKPSQSRVVSMAPICPMEISCRLAKSSHAKSPRKILQELKRFDSDIFKHQIRGRCLIWARNAMERRPNSNC